jgi:hypothetical protein
LNDRLPSWTFGRLVSGAMALALLAGPARAAPLPAAECDELKVELLALETADVTRPLEMGPEWARSNLDKAALERVHRYVEVEETVRFRCPVREPAFDGKIPPLPVASPHRADKLKDYERIVREQAAAEAARAAEERAEALRAEEERRAAEARADAAAKEAIARAEAEAALKPAVADGAPVAPAALISDSPQVGPEAAAADEPSAGAADSAPFALMKQPAPGEASKTRRIKPVPVQAVPVYKPKPRVDLPNAPPAANAASPFSHPTLRPSFN